MSSDDRVFERRIVSKRRTSANLEDTPEKQCPNGWAGVVAAAAAAASSSSSSLRQKAAACKISQRTTFQPHPDSICDWFFKVMVLGDSGVGKTCLLVRFRDDMFLGGNYISTVGVDFRNKIISVDDSKVKLQIWDTAGQERFRSVTHAYYRDAHALLLLYDVTNKVSFDNTRAWLSEIRDYANDQVVIMLIGNKADCSLNDRMVKREDGEQLAKEYSVTFMETSAKSGFNVEIAFMAVARELLFRKTGIEKKGSFNVQDYVKEQTKTNCPACTTT
ncbi:ras-related protein Rab-37 isoform X1 [Aphis gossypii]|uniref:ras-related protein Rab-37 isoform X1 n=1 Tax=Aphis gossypii TaxID=80765 RepID=UPI00100FB365|nr:ras-related protein Rab-37 isoform X1 [Aphis gossypii]XP_027846836.1 ras-related protein Rab-37 isoform X1 [Aphis gossypii]